VVAQSVLTAGEFCEKRDTVLNARAAFRLMNLVGTTDGWSAPRVLCFPLAGLVLGGLLAIVNRLISPYLPSEILAAALVTILVLATAGHYLTGTHVTFNKLPKSYPPTAVEGQHVCGMLAVLLVILFKTHSLAVVGESRALSLLLSPLFARWSVLLFLFGSGTLTDDATQPIAESIRPWHLVLISTVSLAVALFTAGEQALWVALSLSCFVLIARSYLTRRAGFISLANCGAVVEVSEALSFTLFTSL
jgi:cobalamin synthase